MDRAFYVTARFFPGLVRRRVDTLLRLCGSDLTADYWLGRAFVISTLVFVVSSVALFLTVENFLETMLLLVVALTIYHAATYLILYFKSEGRGRAVERVLPNLLQLIAANLNSGMTPFQAVKESSRLEFGILKYELDRAIALSLSTMQFPEALMDMTTRVRSDVFRDVVELFIEGMRTGGPLATLLSDIAKDITEDLDLKREISTRSKTYVLFIGFIVIIGTPLLSAVSIHFIRTINDITNEAMAEIPELQNVGGITFGRLTLTPEFLAGVAIVNMVVTSLIASWLLAVIRYGKDKYMVKYAVVIVPATLLVYAVFDYIIGLVL
jgi:hypothetical protein